MQSSRGYLFLLALLKQQIYRRKLYWFAFFLALTKSNQIKKTKQNPDTWYWSDMFFSLGTPFSPSPQKPTYMSSTIIMITVDLIWFL